MAESGWFGWLTDLLQAQAWKALGLAAGCFLLLWMHSHDFVTLSSSTREWLAVVGTISAFMVVTAAFRSIYGYFPLYQWLAQKIARRRAAQELRDYIPYMTKDERKIIGYLIFHNQKTFTAALDGGHAATLVARKIVTILARPGQRLNPEDVPMAIPDHLWAILVENKEQFPYAPPANGKSEPHPWRVHWMVR